jgi:ribose-phosphate pyrophosphokinase
MTPEELLDVVTLNDDLISKKIPRGRKPKVYTCPDFEIPVKYTRFANGEVKAELMQAVRGLRLFIIYDLANQYPVQVAGSDEPVQLSINDHLLFLHHCRGGAHRRCPTGSPWSSPPILIRQHKKSGARP